MADNSLRVNPDALVDGAQRFHETHEALRDLLANVHGAQEELLGKWTGGAANKGNTMWSDLHDAFSTHIDLLADNADKLHTAAGWYRDRDGEAGSNIDRQM